MLASLAIHDVVLIDRLELNFHPRLCVLTGETGAGKSILLDALTLALGARGDAALVRRATNGAAGGSAQAVVTAVFEVAASHPSQAIIAEQGLALGEPGGALILRRLLTADGRSRAFVNDQPVSVALLRRLGDTLVEIEGQFAVQRLIDATHQRTALDSFAGLEGDAAALALAFRAWRDAEGMIDDARRQHAEAAAAADDLRFAVAELAELAPKQGEEGALASERAILMHAEKLVEALDAARLALAEGDGVDAALRRAARPLERASENAGGRFDAAIAALHRAAEETAAAGAALAEAARAVDLDPRRLEGVESRLFALRAAARKHRCDADLLPALHAELDARLAALDDRGDRLAALATAAEAARGQYRTLAKSLSVRRQAAADSLARAVSAELPPLRLDKARFTVRLEPLAEDDWAEHGIDRVAFEVATNPGAVPGPIGRIASAGELSRFLLALKVVLTRAGSAPTLVFDEVDAGIGGATAAAVGERLQALAETLQVLVITHSPQVAARAAQHWRVAKDEHGGASVTRVDELAPKQRREEIARMLAGARVTDEARAAADRLIAGEVR